MIVCGFRRKGNTSAQEMLPIAGSVVTPIPHCATLRGGELGTCTTNGMPGPTNPRGGAGTTTTVTSNPPQSELEPSGWYHRDHEATQDPFDGRRVVYRHRSPQRSHSGVKIDQCQSANTAATRTSTRRYARQSKLDSRFADARSGRRRAPALENQSVNLRALLITSSLASDSVVHRDGDNRVDHWRST